MKKISMKEFDSMLESDKDFAARLKDYLGDTEDPQAAGEKTMEFLKKEGYELDKDTIEELSDDDLENVSGGSNLALGIGKAAWKVGKFTVKKVLQYCEWSKRIT